MEWAFDNFERVTLLDENTEGVLREVSVSLSDETDHVIVQPVGSIEATLPTDYDPARVEYQVELADGVEAPVEKGTKLGTVSVVYDDVNYGTLDLVAADSVARSDFQYYVKTVKDYLGMWWVRALLIVAVALILFLVVWLGVIRPRRKRATVTAAAPAAGGTRAGGGDNAQQLERVRPRAADAARGLALPARAGFIPRSPQSSCT